jgi:glycine oxidase
MSQDRAGKENTIIGWGLAGAILSWQLYFKKRPFKVYDSTINHSTRVAAGMVNPIVFKRLTKGWNADTLLPYAELFFTNVEKELGVQLISGKNIWRIFASVEEQNNWS